MKKLIAVIMFTAFLLMPIFALADKVLVGPDEISVTVPELAPDIFMKEQVVAHTIPFPAGIFEIRFVEGETFYAYIGVFRSAGKAHIICMDVSYDKGKTMQEYIDMSLLKTGRFSDTLVYIGLFSDPGVVLMFDDLGDVLRGLKVI